MFDLSQRGRRRRRQRGGPQPARARAPSIRFCDGAGRRVGVLASCSIRGAPQEDARHLSGAIEVFRRSQSAQPHIANERQPRSSASYF